MWICSRICKSKTKEVIFYLHCQSTTSFFCLLQLWFHFLSFLFYLFKCKVEKYLIGTEIIIISKFKHFSFFPKMFEICFKATPINSNRSLSHSCFIVFSHLSSYSVRLDMIRRVNSKEYIDLRFIKLFHAFLKATPAFGFHSHDVEDNAELQWQWKGSIATWIGTDTKRIRYRVIGH